MSFRSRISRGCVTGVVVWLIALVVIKILSPTMTDGSSRVVAVFFFPLFWVLFWPNMLLGHYFRGGAPTWVQYSEPFLEYLISLCGWLFVCIVVTSIVHVFRQRHEA
jgi:hypothetical protein